MSDRQQGWAARQHFTPVNWKKVYGAGRAGVPNQPVFSHALRVIRNPPDETLLAGTLCVACLVK